MARICVLAKSGNMCFHIGFGCVQGVGVSGASKNLGLFKIWAWGSRFGFGCVQDLGVFKIWRDRVQDLRFGCWRPFLGPLVAPFPSGLASFFAMTRFGSAWAMPTPATQW